MQVYTRWGELVFENTDFAPNDPSLGWDGSINGRQAHAAVYVYRCMVSFLDGRQEVIEGDVVVVR